MSAETFGPLGSPKYVGYAGDVAASGRYLLAVISDVLEMARLESGRVQIDPKAVDAAAALGSATAGLRETAAAKDVALTVDVAPGAALWADARALDKVLTALLDNAVKFTGTGGKVGVRVRSAVGGVNIFVEDDGIGIASDTLAGLGRPFTQAGGTMTDGMKGSGLGLAIARSLVEMHDGSLRIRSLVGRGTIVMLHLPNPAAPKPTALRRPVPPRLATARQVPHGIAEAARISSVA